MFRQSPRQLMVLLLICLAFPDGLRADGRGYRVDDPKHQNKHRIILKLKAGSSGAGIAEALKLPASATFGRLSSVAAPAQLSALSKFYRIDIQDLSAADELLAYVGSRPEVESAYFAPRPVPPPGKVDLAPTTPSFTRRQRHFRDSPIGFSIKYARALRGGRGQQVKIVDIEYGWELRHEDLPISARRVILNHSSINDQSYIQHGTASAGLLSGIKNAYGVTGIADRARLLLAKPFDSTPFYNVAAAIDAAVAATAPGDVLLIEQQFAGPFNACHCGGECDRYVPVEWSGDVYAAIVGAVAQGRIVIEPAGNGGVNLDDPIYGGLFDPALADSGAIMVAAVDSSRQPYCFSNQGRRIDVQALGGGVVTTGYGDLFSASSLLPRFQRKQYYTADFGGTSSASAIVAGMAAQLQGYAKARGVTLTPAQMRSYLRDTGLPPTFGDFGNTPDLRAAIAQLNADYGF